MSHPSRRTVLTATATTAAALTLGAAPARAVPTLPGGTSQDKVLVVGMDGLRHDRIAAANAPHLKAMMSEGTYGTSLLYANPMAATSSGPGWSTISTGVWPDKHGVKDNTFAGKKYGQYPGFLARLTQVRPALSTYAAVDWLPLDTQGTITPGADAKLVLDGDRDGYTGHDATIAAEAEAIIKGQNPDVLFVYFGQSDIVGHNQGAGSQAYLDQIAVQDAYLGRLRAAIKARPSHATERWTVIVATDHGHTDPGGHGGSSVEERRTFVLATGPGIAAGARPIDTRLVDVVPTVLKQLGIPVDPAWGLDGKPIQERSADPFDTLQSSLTGRVDETGIPAGVLGFTHTPPSGWSLINNAMGTGGVTEWRGWSFATDEFWSRTQRDQSRELNVRARGVFAVADSDEWSDKSFSGNYDTTLVTPAYDVTGKTTVRLDFTTFYRQEGAQSAQILVSFNLGAPTAVKSYTSDVISQPQSVNVPVPAGASSVSFRFHYTGSNNWYWVIDGVKVTTS
ncbi:type I phosphodiesterase/nucleotide pyrophosphatase [Streptomyces davaonensis JCM 4913]|uniref:Type I phosphodiesterase/nucleotide pyrophosphatase n=1 Tax=Streptomyces davaonensis (strain DSM 101723 / JCM 4913 / KCC S-0913 / 768) TaxID=1214101 RepID=K4R9L8_STRDJ|nr:alkaline phosphatase family protein [Streptomyces davaonensis]CCK29807.1 type I phosphodiesterase/nucleotide pyrophosphatase [Streptomyces davaonensis JCM 4913]